MTEIDDAAPALPDPDAAEAALVATLRAWNVPFTRHAHAPLHTVEDSVALRGELPGGHCKNLFLKETKGPHWLVVCEEARRVRIPDIARAAGAGRMSFGTPDAMAALLGVRPGAVTPLGLVNDAEGQVRLILDAQLFAAEILNCHPLRNDATAALRTADLLRGFEATGHAPIRLDFDALEAQAAAAQAAQG